MKNNVFITNRNFLYLFIGSTTSKLGLSFFQLCLPLLVYSLTKAANLMAFTYFCELAPQVLFSLLGGAMADQISRRKILIIGDILSSIFVLVIPIAAIFNILQVWIVYGVAFILASISAFYHPSFESIMPEILSGDNLVQGNSFFRLSETLTSFIGPSIAGFLIAFIGNINLLYFTAFTFLFSSFCVYLLRISTSILNQNTKIKLLKPIKEGLHYVFSTNVIRTGTIIIFLINVGYGAVESLFIFYLKDIMKLSSQSVGLVVSLETLGSLIAVYLVNKLKNISRGKIIIFSGIIIGLGQILLVLSHSLIILLVLGRIIVLGATTMLSINWFTLRQEIVPSYILGRVISSTRMVSYFALPFSGIIAGILAKNIEVPTIFLMAGVITIVFSILGLGTSLFRYNNCSFQEKTDRENYPS